MINENMTLALEYPDPMMTDKNVLTLLNETPDFTVSAELVIEPLAPLSIVTRMPGKYYRSDDVPTPAMLYGLLENALGWHISREHRADVLKTLAKRFKTAATVSNSGFQPLLQYHVQFDPIISRTTPFRYSDYWARLARTKGLESANGSREYSAELIPLMNEVEFCKTLPKGAEKTTLTDGGGVKILNDVRRGDKVNVSGLHEFLPHYYLAPATREYIEPDANYSVVVRTSRVVASLLERFLNDPTSPLYLGSNDGWVEAIWIQR